MTERVKKLVAGNAALTRLADSHLLGLIEPDDIASTALYLASDESRMVTGQVLSVDSGVTISRQRRGCLRSSGVLRFGHDGSLVSHARHHRNDGGNRHQPKEMLRVAHPKSAANVPRKVAGLSGNRQDANALLRDL